MVSTDPIADMLTRIRNAILVNKNQVSVPYSSIKAKIAGELVKNGYIDSVKEDGKAQLKSLSIVIHKTGTSPRINEITRISKPGRRIYSKVDSIPIVKSGRGVVLISTSRGIMTGRDAVAAKLGGEVICEVY